MKLIFHSGNNLTLLRNGEEYFPALEHALHQAQHEIYFETYIFESDTTGERIAVALEQAVKRGVIVHLLIDGFGSNGLPKPFKNRLKRNGVELLIYRPSISPWAFNISQLRRLHRKLVVVDRRTAFIGGINIIDDVDANHHSSSRFDYAVRVQGPLVSSIYRSMRRLWRRVAWTQFAGYPKPKGYPLTLGQTHGKQQAAFVTRDNIRHRHDIEKAYLDAIEAAKKEIIIANAYFFPGIRFRRALTNATHRGVNVILLLQGRVEYWLFHHASRAFYGPLLDAGVQIYEYNKGFLHAKVAVIDRRWATIGSSNIDPYSFLLAREANVIVDNHIFAGTLHTSLMEAIDSSAVPVPSQEWFKQPLYRRILIWFNYSLMRIFTGIVGYR